MSHLRVEDLDWRPHPLTLLSTLENSLWIAKYKGLSIVKGSFAEMEINGPDGYEVMDLSGEVHRYLEAGDVEDMINERDNY